MQSAQFIKSGKTRWAEKTPLHVNHIDKILKHNPQIKDPNKIQKTVKIKTGKLPFIFSSHTKNGIDVLIDELFNQCKK